MRSWKQSKLANVLKKSRKISKNSKENNMKASLRTNNTARDLRADKHRVKDNHFEAKKL